MHQPLTPSGAVLTSFSLVIFPGLEGETRRYRQFCDLPSSRYSLRVRGHGKEPKKMSVEKAYDPSDPSFKFVDRLDEIDPYRK
jgi:hypothetical protein